MDNDTDELRHHGVKGTKRSVRRTPFQLRRHPKKLSIGKNDTAVTKRVKNDYNRLSDGDFKRKYQVSKVRYAKRVAKSASGDPFADRRAKMTKSYRKYQNSREGSNYRNRARNRYYE